MLGSIQKAREAFNAPILQASVIRNAVYKQGTHILLKLLTLWCVLCLYVNHAFAIVRKHFPSSVIDVFYVDPNTRIAMPIYAPSWPSLTSGWSNWHANHTKSDFAHTPSSEGVYVFRVWNQMTEKNEEYILSPKHLIEALQLKSLAAMWAFSDVGIVTMLQKYTESASSGRNTTVFDLTVDGVPALHNLKSYMPSIMIPENVTAHTLAIWYTYLRWEYGMKNASLAYPFDTSPTVVITDDDANEHTFTNKEVLFARKKEE